MRRNIRGRRLCLGPKALIGCEMYKTNITWDFVIVIEMHWKFWHSKEFVFGFGGKMFGYLLG